MSEAALQIERFLRLLTEKRVEAATELLAEDVEYSNVSLPTVRGRERVRRLLEQTLGRHGVGFEVYTHAISVSGNTVLTERTDVLKLGSRLRIQVWVCGRFDLDDGERSRSGATTSTGGTPASPCSGSVPAVRARPPRAT